MADLAAVARLRQPGQRAWNSWRAQNRQVPVNLRGARLDGLDLQGRNLRGANLVNARLAGANLRFAMLEGADLSGADLSGCELSDAEVNGARMIGTRMTQASAVLAYFFSCDFTDADLSGTDLRDSFFVDARFIRSRIVGANVEGAFFEGTVFGGVDLSEVIGLERTDHGGPSILDHRTLQSAASVPVRFLRGCGLPETVIERLGELFGRTRYYSCFISYAGEDERFARRLEGLLDRGIRCWFAPSSMRAGEPVRATLQRQVRGNDRLIVVASTASLASEWVRLESREALAREAEGETVIVPLRIDDAVMTSRTELARDLRRRSIADFTGWQRARAFAQAVDGLARSLEENAPTPDAP